MRRSAPEPLARAQRAVRRCLHPGPLGPPAAQVVIVTCLDHRVDPAITLGLQLSPKVSVSGHVYDIATGRVTTVLDARHPQLAGTN